MPELKITPEQQACMQTKLDGFNDCFNMMYSMLCDCVGDSKTPESVKAFLHGFTDCMYRDLEDVCKAYAEKVIEELSQKGN